MAFVVNSKVLPTKIINSPTQAIKPPYEIPERYRNSFYLANAAFFDSTNWFLHKAYEVIFPKLRENLRSIKGDILNNYEIADKIEDVVKVLDQCNSVIDVRFPIKRDNGRFEMIRGFRAHYGLATGYNAALGGLRIHEHITRDHMKALSVLAAYRNACSGIFMSGACGGIKINPTDYSQNELKNIVETYGLELRKQGYCNERDIFYPDINASHLEMQWIHEALRNCSGNSDTVAVTGISNEDSVFRNYNSVCSFGAYVSLDYCLQNEELTKKIGIETGLKGKTFIIQGMGKVGSTLAELLSNCGAICVGVKDIDAYIYDQKGINLKELSDHKAQSGSIRNFGMAKEGENDSIYMEQCDILIFAAQQKSLICYVADKVKAKILVEAADGPITPSAHQILLGKQKLVIPDLYACAGTSIISYLEYLYTLRKKSDHIYSRKTSYTDILDNLYCGEQSADANGKISESKRRQAVLTESVVPIFRNISEQIFKLTTFYKLGTDLRTAAYIIGITNVFKSIFEENKFI